MGDIETGERKKERERKTKQTGEGCCIFFRNEYNTEEFVLQASVELKGIVYQMKPRSKRHK